MKTPSQRAKGKVKKPRLKTKLEVDIDNGFDASGYLIPQAANYRMVKNAMERQRAGKMKAIEKQAMEDIKKHQEEERVKRQERINRKNKTIFDVIDIDD